MTLEEAIHDTLLALEDITTALGSDKIFYGQVQQGVQLTPPYIRFWAVSRSSTEAFGGEVGPLYTRYQFDCYAPSMPEARDLARLVRQCLQGYQGVMPVGAPGGDTIFVQSVRCEGDAGRDGYDDAVSLHVCSVDLTSMTKDT